MNKLAKLFKYIDNFSIEATFNYQMVKLAAPNQELLNKYDDFEFNDEKLFSQVEDYIDLYKTFLNSLKINAENLDPTKDDMPGELLKTLGIKLDRINDNPYLNIAIGSDWNENFDPGDLLQFLADLYEDAGDKLKEFSGQDFELSEMMANQIAKDLNQQGIDKGDKNLTFTGDGVKSRIKSKQHSAEERALDKKSNPDKYNKYIEIRRKQYKEWFEHMKKTNPERLAEHREMGRKRFERFQRKLEDKKQEIIKKLQKETHPYTVNKLENELHEIEVQIQERQKEREDANKFYAQKIKEKKNSGTLGGLIVHFNQRLASFKKDTAVATRKRGLKDPVLAPFKLAEKNAQEAFDKDPSPANKAAHEDAVKKEIIASNEYLNNNQIIKKILEDFVVLYAFRDKLKEDLDKSGWLELPEIPEEIKPILIAIANDADDLVNKYGPSYPGPLKIIQEVSKLIRSKI